jgi:eukaryotic translation initiation factor 2C
MYTRPVPDHLTRNMVENAAYDPSQSQWLIENEGLKQMGFNTPKNEAIQLVSLFRSLWRDTVTDPTQRNGVPISLYPSMLKLPSARLPFPVVQYALNSYKRPNTVPRPKIGSGWNLSEEDGFFSVKAKSLNYVLLHRLNNSTAQPTMATFDRELKSQMNKRLGMKIDQVKCINQGGSSVGPSGENLNSFLATAKNKRADLVVLMLENPDRSIYASFKTLTDRTYGLRSVCVAKPGFLRGGNKDGPKYITNIAQKVNIKLGGYNAQVQGVTAFLGKDTLVLGADVVHPGHGAIPDAPSIACIVGSVDHEGGRFLGSARLQSKDKQDREVRYIFC